MSEESSGDKTHAPTEARLQRARDEGQTPLSREVVTLASLAVSTLFISMAGPGLVHDLGLRLQRMLAQSTVSADAALRDAGMALVLAIVPLLTAIAFASGCAVMLQTSGVLNKKALIPSS